ncbi:uncharacterized protein LOC120284076 [Dioscorea cayenensis subsp. rotundata]|uniref:Uncharacterized protein LOC120284076 n=1 Tax=Dioscorea cayennensis subsp. rotundata TaxID=55577 RepID=A0AB40D7G6_DIOCR|nr:uncharacterized protein LOC120284076 [Dioscorea cayenensis subsp. rotundata]
METFCVVARYKGEGRMLQFTILSSWETVMGDISERWALDGSQVRVKFVTPDSYKTLCPIESNVDFQRMCHIHHTFNKTVVDIIIEDANGSMDNNSGSLIPSNAFSASMNADVKTYLSQHPSAGALSIVQSSQTLDRDHGVRLPYKRVWMGKEIARAAIHSKEVSSYDLLLWYADKVAEMNPGSFVIIENDGDRFKRAFFSFRACLLGFKLGWRPLLFIDGTHLLGKYGEILLGVTAKDGNEGIFHVAFAVVDNETDDNWTWFLATLGEALYGEDDYDKANGSLGKSLKEQCWSVIVKIAYAYTSKEFDDATHELVAISIDAHDWLLHKSDIDHWCNYLFKGMQWCEMYSNVAESFNAWIKEARHLLVTSMVDTIRFKLMKMLTEWREVSAMWDTYLCPEIRKKVEQIVEISRFSRVGRSSDDTYEVVDEHNNAVNLRLRKCSCRRWDVHGLTCKHTTAVIMQTDTNVHCYVDQYFTAESYCRTYAEPIYLIPDSDKPSDDDRQLRMRPPIAKKRPGRPRKKQIESQCFDVLDLHCGRLLSKMINFCVVNDVIVYTIDIAV